MEFDKTRVYTAVNADELKVDSLIITAENLAQLEHKVELNIGIETLIEIADKDYSDRFGIDINDGVEDICYFPLAYLIELPKEPEYKPFSDLVVAMEAIKKHGGWVQEHLKIGENQYFITAFNFEFDNVDEIFFNNSWHSRDELFNDFFFADDGSPCGELVEE